MLAKCAFFQNPLPWPSSWRVALLRAFGSKVGSGVVVRQGCNVTFPWRVSIGNDVWIGEETTILSLGRVTIGPNVCISQQAYICTGSHDHSKDSFDLVVRPVEIRSGSWIAARAFIAPGVTVAENALVAAGSVVVHDVPPHSRVGGNPAREIAGKPRQSLTPEPHPPKDFMGSADDS